MRKMPEPITRGRESHTTGWVQGIEQRALQLQAEQAALEARLQTAVRGEPVIYKGVHIFTPSQATIAVDYLQNGTSSALCNVVVPDAQTFDIPIRVTGPGVFQAHSLQVSVYKRLFAPTNGAAISASNPGLEQWINYSSNILWAGGAQAGFVGGYTTKFCLFPYQPGLGTPGAGQTSFRNWNAINFFWNLFDGRNNDYLSDQLISHLALRPRTSYCQDVSPSQDGGMFNFATPWSFERDANIVFQFRAITPVLQFDSSVDITALTNPPTVYDNRENSIRNETVKVEVEIIGHTFITDQDVAQSGARSTQRGSTAIQPKRVLPPLPRIPLPPFGRK